MPRITIVPTDGSLGPRSRASVDRLPLDVEVAGAGEARGDLLLFLESGDVLVEQYVVVEVEDRAPCIASKISPSIGFARKR